MSSEFFQGKYLGEKKISKGEKNYLRCPTMIKFDKIYSI